MAKKTVTPIKQPSREETGWQITAISLKLVIKTLLISLGITVMLLVITAGIAGYFAYTHYQRFLSSAGVTHQDFRSTIERGLAQTPVSTNDRKNVLLLGVDTLKTRGETLPLTDTMMLLSLNVKTGQITTVSFPRDLWSEKYRTKINALYAYGIERFPNEPARFPKETLEEMTGVPIHHTVVLSMDQVSQIIDTLGGVEVEVKQGFTDPEFPRTDVDVTVERDPAKLYETVTFEPGKEVMSGDRALKFMRSRHSADEQGTDTARALRQQQVIDALISKMRQKAIIANPEVMGTLYAYYQENFAKMVSVEEGIATLRALAPVRNAITMKGKDISIYPENPQGLIWHPPTQGYDGQWVYAVRDEATFTAEIRKILELE